jgi:S-formylglutathione hydrolase FrmB
MALMRCDFFSEALELSTSMTVILPQETSSQIGMAGHSAADEFPTLYLLHGLSDDDTTWIRRTSIERYVAPLGLAVVMPQGGRSFYTDEAHGNSYWTFLSEELPAVASSFFRLSTRREDTFVAGLSMGGYGALKWALRQPRRFAGAAALSSAIDVQRVRHLNPVLWDNVFGDVLGADENLFELLRQATELPRLYLACGTEDPLYDDNVRFHEAAARRGADVRVDFGPGGHDWAYWDARIQDVLAWLR